jgi:hypothetical protein
MYEDFLTQDGPQKAKRVRFGMMFEKLSKISLSK